MPVRFPNLEIRIGDEAKTGAFVWIFFAAWDFLYSLPRPFRIDDRDRCSDQEKSLPREKNFNEVKD